MCVFSTFRQWFTFIEWTTNAANSKKWNFLQQSGIRQISPGWRVWLEPADGLTSGKDFEFVQEILHRPRTQWLVHQTCEVKRLGEWNDDEHNRLLSHQHCKLKTSKLTLALNFEFTSESITRTRLIFPRLSHYFVAFYHSNLGASKQIMSVGTYVNEENQH